MASARGAESVVVAPDRYSSVEGRLREDQRELVAAVACHQVGPADLTLQDRA